LPRGWGKGRRKFDYNRLWNKFWGQELTLAKYQTKIGRTGWRWATLLVLGLGLPGLMFFASWGRGQASPAAQMPTGSIPTVTSQSQGAAVVFVRDNEQGLANLRAGPSAVDYEIVGVLYPGAIAPALGRTIDWILVEYPGIPGGKAWIYAPLVDVRGEVPEIEAPPTPTPFTTPTLDPTLAAQLLVDLGPTRLPTYTEPPPLVVATFPVPAAAEANTGLVAGVPIGLIIVGLAVVGLFGGVISLLRGG
jgi:hypothetical protein